MLSVPLPPLKRSGDDRRLGVGVEANGPPAFRGIATNVVGVERLGVAIGKSVVGLAAVALAFQTSNWSGKPKI